MARPVSPTPKPLPVFRLTGVLKSTHVYRHIAHETLLPIRRSPTKRRRRRAKIHQEVHCALWEDSYRQRVHFCEGLRTWAGEEQGWVSWSDQRHRVWGAEEGWGGEVLIVVLLFYFGHTTRP